MPSLKKPEDLVNWFVCACICVLIGTCTAKEVAKTYQEVKAAR